MGAGWISRVSGIKITRIKFHSDDLLSIQGDGHLACLHHYCESKEKMWLEVMDLHLFVARILLS